MPALNLNIIIIPTFSVDSLTVLDISTYPDAPFEAVSPTIEICVPGFDTVFLPFDINNFNTFTSSNFGITEPGVNQALPDGMYHFKYSIYPSLENFVEKSIMRVDRLQEKFDEAFLSLEMMECDKAIKKQSMADLDTIYYLIQGAIASGNNCMNQQAMMLYKKATNMLKHFMNGGCGCNGGNNFVTKCS